MKKIVLLCAQGMSTGMLMNKMREIADKTNFDCEIKAFPISQINKASEQADCLLVGPQVRYELENVRNTCPDIPSDVIDMVAYGRLDGAKVLEMAKKLMGM